MTSGGDSEAPSFEKSREVNMTFLAWGSSSGPRCREKADVALHACLQKTRIIHLSRSYGLVACYIPLCLEGGRCRLSRCMQEFRRCCLHCCQTCGSLHLANERGRQGSLQVGGCSVQVLFRKRCSVFCAGFVSTLLQD